MQRMGTALLALVMVSGMAIQAQAISLGVGIGVGRYGGVFGEVGTRWPERECRDESAIRLTKEQRAQLAAVNAVTKELDDGRYETVLPNDTATAADDLMQALIAEEWIPAARTFSPEERQLVCITAFPSDRMTAHWIGKRPELTLYWQAMLTVFAREGRTVVVWRGPSRGHARDVDRARGEALQARLVQALVRTASR